MSGLWPRAIGAAIGVVVLAILLKVLPPALVLVVFVGGLGYAYTTGRRRAGDPERRNGADLLGLRREEADPFGIVGYPLALFSRASDPRVEDVVWGTWRSLDVHAFSLSFEPSVLAEEGKRWAFACAMAKVETNLPALVAEPQTFLSLLQGPPAAASIQVGDPAFDRDMYVWCDDEAYARRAIDAPMREWLRAADQRWGVELLGRVAMIYGPKPERPDIMAALVTLRGVLERLPKQEAAPQPPAV